MQQADPRNSNLHTELSLNLTKFVKTRGAISLKKKLKVSVAICHGFESPNMK